MTISDNYETNTQKGLHIHLSTGTIEFCKKITSNTKEQNSSAWYLLWVVSREIGESQTRKVGTKFYQHSFSASLWGSGVPCYHIIPNDTLTLYP